MATAPDIAGRIKPRLVIQPWQFLYAVLLVELVGSVWLAVAFGFRAATPLTFLPHLYCFLLVACGPLLRRIDWPRLAGACESVGFLYGQGFALVALLYPMTAIALPFADAQLAAADRAMGFDWPHFAALFRNHPTILTGLRLVYFSFAWQGAIILPALFLTGRFVRGWTIIFAANLALLLTLIIYPFFPAEGTFLHYGIKPGDYPNMSAAVAWSFGPAIHAIREEGARYITRGLMVPFISFPSYHAVAAMLLAWGAWPIRRFRWPCLLLNAAMAASALIIGAHYLVDILAGGVVAIVALAAASAILAVTCGIAAPKNGTLRIR